MAHDGLAAFTAAAAAEAGIPGMAAGVLLEGRELSACHGVTSADNPLPVDRDTLFGIGSVSKTFTATAMMRLVAAGKVELAAPVRRYVPGLRLAGEPVPAQITVLNLLNHTSGMDWGLVFNSGEGDDALARYVAKLGELEVIAPPGTRVSYSQAAYNLAGRIIENVTGLTFEQAVTSLVSRPVGLTHSFYLHEEVMTRRFAVGHNRGDDGNLAIARLRRRPRGDNPGGGLASSVSDLLRWARFHLGDGRAGSGERVLPAGLLQQMRQPTASLRGSNLGHAVGICWFLRTVDGVPAAGHSGSTNGQFAELLLVPERDFAVVSLANAGPDGIPANQAIVRWALRTFLGLTDRDPEPLPYDEVRAREIIGSYETDVMDLTISRTDGPGLQLTVRMKPEARAAYPEMPPDHAPFGLGLLPGSGDEYILTSGAFAGQRGFFSRDGGGAVTGVDLAGRLYSRVPGR